MAKNVIIADASPLIAFGRIDQILLLSNVLGHIIIPDIVAKECIDIHVSRPGAKAVNKVTFGVNKFLNGD